MRYLIHGLAMWRSHPRAMSTGIIPAVLAAVIVAAMVVGAIAVAPGVGRWSADQVSAGGFWHTVVMWVAGIALVLAAGVVAIKLFVSIALIVGQPFYERISAEVDSLTQAQAAPEEAWWVTTGRGIADALRLLLVTIPLALAGFALGLIPVAGAPAAFTLAALGGGWMLALELTAYPSARRGIVTLRDRRAALRGDRATVWGFGTAVYLVMLIPGAALVVLPVAMAGATRLVSDVVRTAGRPQ